MRGYPVNKVEDPGAVGELDVLLAEVQLQLHEGDDVQHLGAHLLELRGIAAAQLLQGNVVGGPVLGGDQVGDGLGLGQVHPAVQEGPFGKLTGGGHLGPCGYQCPQYLGDNVLGPMTIYLGGVLPGVGVGSPEDHGHDLVDNGLRSIPLRENDPSVVHFPCPELRRPNAAFLLHRPVHPLQHGHRLRAADAHHRDCPLSGSRRPGADCSLLVYCPAVHPIFSLKARHSPHEWCGGTCPPAGCARAGSRRR